MTSCQHCCRLKSNILDTYIRIYFAKSSSPTAGYGSPAGQYRWESLQSSPGVSPSQFFFIFATNSQQSAFYMVNYRLLWGLWPSLTLYSRLWRVHSVMGVRSCCAPTPCSIYAPHQTPTHRSRWVKCPRSVLVQCLDIPSGIYLPYFS